MSSVNNLISLYENMSAKNARKTNVTRKGNSKSMSDGTLTKIRRFQHLTDIKRPNKVQVEEHKVEAISSLKTRCFKEAKKISTTASNSGEDEPNDLETKIIEEKVEEFGKNLRQRRFLSLNENVDSSIIHLEQCAQNNVDKNVNLDDLFGLNDFDENDKEDNYIYEAFNFKSPGEELVKIYLKIERHTVTKNNDNSVKSIETVGKNEILTDSDIPIENYCVILDNVSICNGSDQSNKPKIKHELDKKEEIDYVIEELIHSEKLYIGGLEYVINNYESYIDSKTPPNLLGRNCYIFGNIGEIYKNSKRFLVLLEQNSDDVDKIAQIFVDFALEFELYPLYSKNKPFADKTIKEFDCIVKLRQHELKDKLGLASYLLTPIQRLGKYVLLLEKLKKELNKLNRPAETVVSAINVVRTVMRKGNDFIAMDSIKNYKFEKSSGSFIMRSSFIIHKPKKMTSMVFLFEHVVIFTEQDTKTMEHFNYEDDIPMSELTLSTHENKPNIFHLTNYSKSKRKSLDACYVLEAETPKIKAEWIEAIGKILWNQLKKAKEQQKGGVYKYAAHGKKPMTTKSSASLKPANDRPGQRAPLPDEKTSTKRFKC